MMKTVKQILLGASLFYSALVQADVSFDINGADSDVEKNVLAYLSALDQPRYVNDDSYLLEVRDSAQDALTVFGYYQPQVKVTPKGDDDNPEVRVDLSVGPRTLIDKSNILLSGAGETFAPFVQRVASFQLNKDDPLIHSRYESAKNGLKAVARRYGYFDAYFIEANVAVSSKINRADVTLLFNTGERYQFGELIFMSDIPAQKFVRSLRDFEVGSPFDTNKLGELNKSLSQTGYFKSISILPDVSNKNGLQIPLNVLASMRPADSFSAGIGYSTDEGMRGSFGWKHPWINAAGHSIEGDFSASSSKQEVSFTYKIPLADPLYDYLSLQTGYQKLDQNDTDTTLYVSSISRHWRFDNDWRRTIFLRYEQEEGIQGQQDFETALIIPGISFSRTRSRGGINATWGDKLLVSLEVSDESWLSSDDLIKLYGQAKFIRSYGGHQVITMFEAGAIETESIYNVPSSMRFFTGGDQSIRGFDYESVAPEDADDYLVGGKYLTVASIEYRFPVTEQWKLALFADAGTATDDFSEDLSSSVGAGVVWASPIGPIRLYGARPITNKINDYGIHFMIGPEL